MSVQSLLFSQILNNGDSPLGLFKYLAKKWEVLESPQDFTASRSLRLNTDLTMGGISDTGLPVLEALGALVSSSVEGLYKLALLPINEDGLVFVLNSLFLFGGGRLRGQGRDLFAIQGDILDNRLPAIVRLKAIHFAANSSFVGTPRLDFEGHLSGLTFSLQQNFKDSAHEPAVEGEDDGARLVNSRGLAFIPYATADIVLKQ